MADTEHNKFPLDDPEIEIVSLDAPSNRRDPGSTHRLRLTSGQRKLGLGLTVMLFLLVFGIVFFSTPDIRNLVAQSFFSPTKVSVSKNVLFYLQGDPTWGQFTIDGRPLARLPLIGQDQPLSMSPGTHHIAWQAAPFTAQDCVFTVVNMVTFSSPCLVAQSIQSVNLGAISHLAFPPNTSVMGFTFFASMRNLSSEQHMLLVQQIQDFVATYSDSEPVSPGEVYAVSAQASAADPALCKPVMRFALCYAQAKQPLIAHLSIQADISTSPDDPCVVSEQCTSNQQDCRQLCNPFYGIEMIDGWEVQAIVSLNWSYTTPAGQVIAQDQPDSAIRGASSYQSILLSIARDGGDWHVAPLTSLVGGGANDPFCSLAVGDVSTLLDAIGSGIQHNYEQQWADASAHVAAGCLIVAKQLPSSDTSALTPVPASPPLAYFLQRFGVTLSVNDVAHSLLPDLPVADSTERNLAQKLLLTLSP